MLQVFAHPDLSHQLVLVPVHACELTHMSEDVLQSVSQLQHRNTPLVTCANQYIKLLKKKIQIKSYEHEKDFPKSFINTKDTSLHFILLFIKERFYRYPMKAKLGQFPLHN